MKYIIIPILSIIAKVLWSLVMIVMTIGVVTLYSLWFFELPNKEFFEAGEEGRYIFKLFYPKKHQLKAGRTYTWKTDFHYIWGLEPYKSE